MRIWLAIAVSAAASCALARGADPAVDAARQPGQPVLRFVPAAPWSPPAARSNAPMTVLPQPVVHPAQQPPESIPPGPVAGPAQAGQGAPMTLADFEGLALATNPVISRAGARVEAARGNWDQ